MNILKTSRDKEAVKKILPYILATSIFMEMLDSTILNTTLPHIARSFSQPVLDVQMVVISYALTLAVFIPISGFLADRFGTKKVFLFALITFVIGSALSAASLSLNMLVASRVIQGIGGSMMNPIGKLTLIKAFSRAEYVKVFNFAVIPALLGPVLGPVVGGYLVDVLSWHWIFIINIPIGLFAMALTMRYMPNFREEKSSIDALGFIIFSSASVMITLALDMVGKRDTWQIMAMLAMGLLSLFIYYIYAKKHTNPLFSLVLFKIRTFRLGIAGNIACRLGISAIPILVPLMLQLVYGKSALISGLVVAPMSIMIMVGKYFVIKLLKKFGYRKVLMGNTIIIGVIILSLGLHTKDMSPYWFAPSVAILGFFNSIQFTSMNSIIIADLRPEQVSSGNSLAIVNQQLSIGFGIAVGFVILRIMEKLTCITHQDTHLSFQYSFFVLGGLTIVSSLVFARLHPKDGDNLRK